MGSPPDLPPADTSPSGALDRFRLDGRVVVVTGASSGLGERFARVLAGVGAKVVLAARRIDRLEALAADLPDALAVECDVAAPDGPQSLLDAAVDRYGRLDVLVNNAGFSRVLPAVDDDLEEFRRELDQSLGLALLPVRSQRLDQDRQRGRGKRFSGKRLLR